MVLGAGRAMNRMGKNVALVELTSQREKTADWMKY